MHRGVSMGVKKQRIYWIYLAQAGLSLLGGFNSIYIELELQQRTIREEEKQNQIEEGKKRRGIVQSRTHNPWSQCSTVGKHKELTWPDLTCSVPPPCPGAALSDGGCAADSASDQGTGCEPGHNSSLEARERAHQDSSAVKHITRDFSFFFFFLSQNRLQLASRFIKPYRWSLTARSTKVVCTDRAGANLPTAIDNTGIRNLGVVVFFKGVMCAWPADTTDQRAGPQKVCHMQE